MSEEGEAAARKNSGDPSAKERKLVTLSTLQPPCEISYHFGS